ncbi:MAG: hypothetical protein IKJ99_00880 [Oscillospiraceae bacterium]|nr:hypothetical protein [Oscillospiraceae bacterium]
MNLTPIERRERIRELIASDEECRKMTASLEEAKQRFEQYVSTLPAETRQLLWECPGMAYFLHNRILKLMCDAMRFPDED